MDVSKSNQIVALRALLEGRDVTLGSHVFRWLTEEGKLVIVGRANGGEEEHYINADHVPLTAFIQMCEKLTDKDILSLISVKVEDLRC